MHFESFPSPLNAPGRHTHTRTAHAELILFNPPCNSVFKNGGMLSMSEIVFPLHADGTMSPIIGSVRRNVFPRNLKESDEYHMIKTIILGFQVLVNILVHRHPKLLVCQIWWKNDEFLFAIIFI